MLHTKMIIPKCNVQSSMKFLVLKFANSFLKSSFRNRYSQNFFSENRFSQNFFFYESLKTFSCSGNLIIFVFGSSIFIKPWLFADTSQTRFFVFRPPVRRFTQEYVLCSIKLHVILQNWDDYFFWNKNLSLYLENLCNRFKWWKNYSKIFWIIRKFT